MPISFACLFKSCTNKHNFLSQVVPRCPHCADIPLAIMKPDIVFFGENLPELFHRAMKQDKDEVDLLIAIGSSLKVRPVALIPSMFAKQTLWFFCSVPNIAHHVFLPGPVQADL